ncbi:MAG: methylmalonyl-CoA mutase, partial [Candidatus Zixiibacteriota bacterium]
AVEKNEAVVVGVNRFQDAQEHMEEILKVDPRLEEEQDKRLGELRKNRDNEKVRLCLEALDKTARDKDNIVYPVISAVENYCTLGEISDCLRKVWGEYHEVL